MILFLRCATFRVVQSGREAGKVETSSNGPRAARPLSALHSMIRLAALRMRRFSLAALVILLGLFGWPETAAAQQSRFGAGLQLTASTVGDNIGPGVRFRTSTALNPDISLGIGAWLTGYILQGRDDAAYAFDPQASLIVTLPGSARERLYVLGGGGVYVPFGDISAESGPTIHAGLGKVWLLNESSFFFEFNPALFVGEEQTDVVLPLRVGVIF